MGVQGCLLPQRWLSVCGGVLHQRRRHHNAIASRWGNSFQVEAIYKATQLDPSRRATSMKKLADKRKYPDIHLAAVAVAEEKPHLG